MPKVSIIVPVYNTQKYIEKCLNSLLNQTFKDVEIILVNDGSKDNSETIIKKYIENFADKIKYISKENEGLSKARNDGAKLATGEYIMFVDSDDYIANDLIENLKQYMDRKIDLIKYKLLTVDENDIEINKVDGPVFEEVKGEKAFEILRTTDLMLEVACVYLYRREFWNKHKFEFTPKLYHEDFGLIPLVLVQANSVVSTKNYGYYYLQTNNSITRNTDYTKSIKRANDVLIHYDNMIGVLKKSNLTKKTEEILKEYYTNAVLNKVKELKKKDRKNYIKEIKNRKLIKNIKAHNLKQLVKKMLLNISIDLFLKIS